MDLLSRKEVLLTICLFGSLALVADEDQPMETPQQTEQETKATLAPASSKETSDKTDSANEPIQPPLETNQSSELKPLVLKERIRAHANIDFPQDI